MPAFEGKKIRMTPDGKHIAVIDVMKALEYESPKRAVDKLKQRHPEVVPKLGTYSFGRGRPTTTADQKVILEILMVLPGKRTAQFREWLANLADRYFTADITLADDVFNRSTEDDQKWMRERTIAKQTNKSLNATIKSSGGDCYAQVANMNNVAATGHTAKEIKALRKVKNTREGMTTFELQCINTTESIEQQAIVKRRAEGNGQILDLVGDITNDFKRLMQKYI